MTEADKKQRLFKVLQDYAHVHCNGCDGWLCASVAGEDEKLLQDMINDVWTEIASWQDGEQLT